MARGKKHIAEQLANLLRQKQENAKLKLTLSEWVRVERVRVPYRGSPVF
jgi:hypothetical protein